MATVRKVFRIKVVINGDKVQSLGPGLEPGLIASEDVVFDLPESVYETPLFVSTLLGVRERLLREHITTTAQEIKEV